MSVTGYRVTVTLLKIQAGPEKLQVDSVKLNLKLYCVVMVNMLLPRFRVTEFELGK